MGLFAKMKDILFEEEEVVEKPQEKKVVKEEKIVTYKEEQPISKPIQPEKKIEIPKEEPINTPNNFESERDLFKSDNAFPFPEFDEEEFNNSYNRSTIKKNPTNVLEYERKKRIEKRSDYNRLEKTEIRETTERKKFKPSPIISPVYGILNEDYKIEDIKNKTDITTDALDIESVRKKAFEPERIEDLTKDATYYEETVTVKVKEPEEEREEKVKTIDELLEDTADVSINVGEPLSEESPNEYNEIDEELDEIPHEPLQESIKTDQEFDDDDTLESDLFDLIDSMYDNREDGE